MARRGLAAALLSWCVACSPVTSMTTGDAGPDAWVPEGVTPPRPPTPRALPADYVAALDTSEDGLPVLMESPLGPDGYPVQLVYDDTLDDPIAHWGQCLGRVVACFDANPGLPVTPCLAFVERCESAAGGDGCCPASCLDDFAASTASGMTEHDAVESVFIAGDCVEGFAAMRDASGAGEAP